MENPITRIVEPIARMIAILCGYGIMLLSIAVTVEIIGRKLFAFSLQGIDDIGGYVLAITATIGASYTIAVRGHARVDVFLVRMPASWQRVLNALAIVTLAGFAIFATWRGSVVLMESIEFQSVATNPLQTPLWQPQSIWLFGLALFAIIGVTYAVHAVWLLIRSRPELNSWYGPKTAHDELEAELTALAEREAQAETAEHETRP
ncbi:MAG: TRAP transporter small permease [Gammaproteobacteria bacterium]|nr:TRAP transporter small permease [Gammaproteobacteria bacterium]